MFFIIGAILIVMWLVGFIGLHLLGAYIHIVLVLGVIAMLLGLFTPKTAAG